MAPVEDGNESASDAPVPPPPPPPPPPHDDKAIKRTALRPQRKKKDFREILALFHEEATDVAQSKKAWSSLWQATLAESQEDHKRRRQQEQHGLKRKKGDHEHGSVSVRGSLSRHGSMSLDHIKRARQGSTASTDSSESSKTGRLGGRFPKPGPKASKLKFGGRT